MRRLGRNMLLELYGSQRKQKAVAFALLLKVKTNNSSVIHNYTIYKIHMLTGVSYRTIRKYLDTLKEMGLVVVENGSLYIKRLSSRNKKRNIDISKFKIDYTKNVYNQLRVLLFLTIQAKKDYILSLLRLRSNPIGVDYKRVRRGSRKCCGSPDAEYKEWGLSFGRIARCLGCCKRTALTVVSFAERLGWVKRHNNNIWVLLPCVHHRYVEGYSFTTDHYGCILRADTFTLSRFWRRSLQTDAREKFALRYGS